MTTTIPPMPATDCPSWCTYDHARDWETHLEVVTTPFDVPTGAGGVVRMPARSLAEAVASWSGRTLHARAVYGGACGYVDLELGDDGVPFIVLDTTSNGQALTAEQARTLADALRDAADQLDRLQ